MLIQNVCHKSVSHLQKIVLLPSSGNSEHHTAPCLFSSVFFDLCPATALSHQSLTSSNRPGNPLPYHHISFIWAIKSSVLTMLIQNVCHKSVSHLQKIFLLPFSGNREPHTAPCLFSSVFFDLCPATALSYQSLTSSDRPGNRLPWGNYHHIHFIWAIKSGVLTMLIQNVCHKSVLHLQKIVLLPFSGNSEPHTAPCLFSLVFFDLCPATALSHQSLTSSNRPGNPLP